MRSNNTVCRRCCRGWYSCYWGRLSDGRAKCPCCCFLFLIVVSLIIMGWMYICFAFFNDQDDFNWKISQMLKQWMNWFIGIIIVSAILAIYCFLLLMFALFQIALREPLNLHWIHKCFLLLGALTVCACIAGITLMQRSKWKTVLLSLQATAPFLQIGGVVALTMVSWLVFRGFYDTHRTASKVALVLAFGGVVAAVLLCPLLIHSPCLLQGRKLPPKPALIGHRGAPMLAPENTEMSFTRSVGCNVTAFETDVLFSKDRIPFLMHDNENGFLKRTTDVLEKFPERANGNSANFTWVELQRLNAGNWFLKSDPFCTVSSLSATERAAARNQSLMALSRLLELARQSDTAIIFDLKNENVSGTEDVNDTLAAILRSGLPHQQVLWLPSTNRAQVRMEAPGFRQVYPNVGAMETAGGEHLNVKYSDLSAEEIRELRSRNVSVNLWVVNERWLFSLLWCSGASSVTTNACHHLQDMAQPNWLLDPNEYRMIWIIIDVVSLLIMFGLFHWQRKRRTGQHVLRLEPERTVPLLNF